MAKQIPLAELGQLKKIMAMTTSSNDHEALGFMRKANAILARYGLTWAEVLSRTVSTAGTEVESAPEEMTLEDQIQRAFDEVRGTARGTFAEFLETIETQFNQRPVGQRYLSQSQRAPLFRAVKELRERRKRDG